MKPGGAHLISLVDLGLDPTTLDLLADLIAERVAARLAIPAAPTTRLVDAHEVARRFGVSRSWAYDNAGQLGAIRLGSGPKARLRFNPDLVAHALAANDDPPPILETRTPRRRPVNPATHTASGAPLLHVKDDA
ncbi:MAG: hypothetical protein ACR2KV_14075 [Solirubrobacteraceae bacterium]